MRRPSSSRSPAPVTYLYTLRLADGCFYVGTTSRAPAARLREHEAGEGAAWTRLHAPLGFASPPRRLRVSPEAARLQEDAAVKALMLKYPGSGLERVRGGSYSQATLGAAARALLQRELWHARGACARCGRLGHWAARCGARTTVDGEAVRGGKAATAARDGDSDTEEEDEEDEEDVEWVCGKCGKFASVSYRTVSAHEARCKGKRQKRAGGARL